jgi:hypothetical protein
MSDRQISQATAILIRARDYLSDENRWCPEFPGSFGSRMVGKIEQRCAVHAYLVELNKIKLEGQTFNDLYMGVRKSIEHVARQMTGYDSPVSVNRLGHAKVMELYDKAITLSMERDKVLYE